MSFIRQSADQAREAFTAMPMQSRVISGMLVVVIVIGLGFLVQSSDSKGMDLLFGGRTLGEHEIDAVEISFSAAGLNEWEREGHRIKIPRESRSEYLAALEESAALPMSLRTSVQDAFEKTNIFDPNGLRDARLMHAKELDLGIKITRFPDVKFASVDYDRGERIGLNRARPQSASVVVSPEGNVPLENHRKRLIQDLVRSAYAGMQPEDVVVIDTNGNSSSSTSDNEDPLLKKQREAEDHILQKIRSQLVDYPARIRVRVQIDPTMDIQETTLKYDAEPTNLSTTSKKVESSSSRPASGGVPGAASNGLSVNRGMSLPENQETTKTKEDERESTGVAGQQYKVSRMASLQVMSATVSVGLPDTYYKDVLKDKFLRDNPDKTIADFTVTDEQLDTLREETKTNIQLAVMPLLPPSTDGEDLTDSVAVFHYHDAPQVAPPEPENAKIALTWLAESWQTIALVFLAFVALMVARSAASSGSNDGPSTEFAEGFGLELPAPAAEEEDAIEEDGQMTITGGSLKEELTALVENNPEVAANVIRGWVGEAA